MTHGNNLPGLVCEEAQHIETNACVSNRRDCNGTNGKGTEIWDGQQFGSCQITSCNSTFHKEGNACGTSVTLTNLTLLTAGNIYYPINDTRTPDHVKDYCRYFTGQTGLVNSRGTTENRVIQNFYASCSAGYAQSGCSPERYGDINYFSYNSPVTLSVY